MLEKRRHKRTNIHNPLSYVSLDEYGRPSDQGMGNILDISQGGLLLETCAPIQSKFIKLTFIDTQDEFVNIKAKVVYCRGKEPKIFRIGTRFIESNARIHEIMEKMKKVFSRHC
jgi:hypothetical protein